MEMRSFDKLGIRTSLLGFGCMRFPVDAQGKINEPEAERMIDRAIAAGVNYIDTAYPYHNGDSEPFVGKVLKKYDRGSFYLATKLPCWNVKTLEDVDRLFNEQLSRLQTEYIDFYLMHAMNGELFARMEKLGVVKRLEELKAEGRIRNLGFSFHDSYEAFERIITYRDWDFCQIQLNYMDTKDGPGMRGYELAEKLDIPLVIMEPIKGGSLACFAEDITEVFRTMDKDASIASFAVMVLSGMFAKYLYRRSAAERIRRIEAEFPDKAKREAVLRAQGGVSWAAVVGVCTLMMVAGAVFSLLLGPNVGAILNLLM